MVAPNVAIESNTIVPAGVISNTYEIKIPPITEKRASPIEIKAVCLKLFLYIMAVTFGITNNAEINKIPTS